MTVDVDSSAAVQQWQYGVMSQARELIASERLISVLNIYSIPRTSYPRHNTTVTPLMETQLCF